MEERDVGVACVYVAKDKYKRRAFVCTAMKLQVSQTSGKILTDCVIVSCQGFFFRERARYISLFHAVRFCLSFMQ